MKAPVMKKSPETCLSIRPDGGAELALRPEEIADNQASRLLNFWFKDGALRLRPGLFETARQQYGKILDVFPKDGRRFLLKRITRGGSVLEESYGVYLAAEHAILTFDGETIERVPSSVSCNGSGWSFSYTDYSLQSCLFLPLGSVTGSRTDSGNSLWSAQGDGVYLIGGGKFLKLSAQIVSGAYPAGQLRCTGTCLAADVVPYVPLLTADTSPNGIGTEKEARSLLTPKVSQLFTTDSASTVYRLYDRQIDNASVSAVYTNPVSGATVTFGFDADVTADTESGITANLDRSAGTITFGSALTGLAGVKNSLFVTYRKTVYGDNPVQNCTVGGWYGQEAGSSRIFCSGNAQEVNAVYYSAPGNPAYFPDSCVLLAGDPADPVTAMGKLFDILLLLKRCSVYAVEGETDSFTVRLVHSGDGCRVPESVLPVGNTLAFSAGEGGVYVLRSTQIKDERVVTCVSEPVGPALAAMNDTNFKESGAIADGGHYYLFCGTAAVVLDYTGLDPGTISDAKKIACYLWELPRRLGPAFLYGGGVFAACPDDGAIYRLDPGRADDDGSWFPAYFRTKAFTFGEEQRLKKMGSVWGTFLSRDAVSLRVGTGEEESRSARVFLSGVPDGSACEKRSVVPIGFPPRYRNSLFVEFRRAENDPGAFGVAGIRIRAAMGTDQR